MKKLFLLPLLMLFLNIGCSSDDDTTTAPIVTGPLAAEELLNVAYGTNSLQTMDVYLPEGRDVSTKVIILVHGGSWVAGSKEDMNFLVPSIKSQFPDHAIVNINYRLASASSPAYPNQINDIEQVVDFIESSDYHVSDDYAFIGVSAGAHLSMLYSYAFDPEHDVKAVVDIVGPADFTDPAYTSHPLYQSAAVSLLGTPSPSAELIAEVSPATHVTADAPPTLMFYGGQDPLVPSSQGPLLQQKLDDFGVINQLNFYPDGGHADWDAATMIDVYSKITVFMQQNFN